MSSWYSRQATFLNGTTADATDVEAEFTAILAAFEAAAAAVAALGLGTLVPDPSVTYAGLPVLVNDDGDGFTYATAAQIRENLGAGSAGDDIFVAETVDDVRTLLGFSSDGVSLVSAANYAAMRVLLGIAQEPSATSFNVGTGETYETISALLSYLRGCALTPGTLFTITLTSDITETDGVVLSVGSNCALKIIAASTTKTVTISGSVSIVSYGLEAESAAVFVPPDALVELSSSYVAWCADFSSGASKAVFAVLGTVVGWNVAGDAGGINLSDDVGSSSPTYGIFGSGANVLCDLKASGSAATTLAYFRACNIRCYDRIDSTGIIYLYQCNSRVDVPSAATDLHKFYIEGGTAVVGLRSNLNVGPYAFDVWNGADVSLLSISGSVTLTMTGAGVTSCVRGTYHGEIVISNIDIDISAVTGSGNRCVSSAGGKVKAISCVFTGSASDYALYGSTGAELYAASCTYTTLTGSNLTTSWAVNGWFKNA